MSSIIRRLLSPWQILLALILPGRPWLWGLLYLALIPVFATIYDFKAPDFYQTSATHESYFIDAEFGIERAIGPAVLTDLEYETFHENKPNTIVHSPDVLNVSISATTITVTIGFRPKGIDYYSMAIVIAIDEMPNASSSDKSTYVPFTLTLLNNNIAPNSNDVRLLEAYSSTDPYPTLPIATDRYANFQHAAVAAGGSLSGLPYQWFRMLYFSAVTVTTLGFGDIAPTSNSTRLLVGAEAVLGVVIIGLFLNALARVARQRPQADAKATNQTP